MTEVKEKLEEVYINLQGLYYLALLLGKKYIAIFLDAKTRKTWIYYLQSKDEFVNVFQIQLPKIKKKCAISIKVLYANRGSKFVSSKLKDICKQKKIVIKYATPYMHKNHKIAQQR